MRLRSMSRIRSGPLGIGLKTGGHVLAVRRVCEKIRLRMTWFGGQRQKEGLFFLLQLFPKRIVADSLKNMEVPKRKKKQEFR